LPALFCFTNLCFSWGLSSSFVQGCPIQWCKLYLPALFLLDNFCPGLNVLPFLEIVPLIPGKNQLLLLLQSSILSSYFCFCYWSEYLGYWVVYSYFYSLHFAHGIHSIEGAFYKCESVDINLKIHEIECKMSFASPLSVS
jgi:hypothetical protein